MEIGPWLRSVRINKGLEIKALSLESGLNSSQISRIETSYSDVTVNSIVRIVYGLNMTLNDLLAELEISAFFPRIRGVGLPNKKESVITIQDIETFFMFYHEEPRAAKDLLINAYHEIRKCNQPDQGDKLSEFDTGNIIFEATQAHSKKYLPIPYPKDIKASLIEDLYKDGGVITIRDLAAYVTACRKDSAKSLRQLAQFTDVSYNAIARLERGDLERISFTVLISLDKALDLDGRLIAISWEAGEFHTGVSRIKAFVGENPSPNYGWDGDELAFADTLITITRWNMMLKINKDWTDYLRHIIEFYQD